jgi:predicted 2-oxoglutarate/Fe(II)-dependent dioxygenase YbiX
MPLTAPNELCCASFTVPDCLSVARSAEVTVNVALTDEAEHTGGRLLALYGGRVQEISRREGDATIHSSSLLHGVSRTVRGIRYSFIMFYARRDP